MNGESMAEYKTVTVSQLNGYIKRHIEGDPNLRHVLVEGELSNFKAHSSGHMYFGLKDEGAFIRAVMFRSRAGKLKFRPENGQRVIVGGSISVYERDGQYQLYAETMETAGMGDLYLAFEQMKQKLSNEGLFDLAHKKNLPLLPLRIGVVTSPTGAVWHDIQNVATARFPSIALTLYPAAVQGDAATAEIVRGIEYFDRCGDVDLLIVGRGGGSIEDLWAFNTEPVARAIYHSRLPVISAVGHETDFTIADLVADRRAATPSQAAEIAVPALSDLQARLSHLESALKQKLQLKLNERRGRLDRMERHAVFRMPEKLLNNQMQTVDILQRRLDNVFQEQFTRRKNDYRLLTEKLAVLSPLQTLERGYSIACGKDGRPLRDAAAVDCGDALELRLAHGSLQCRVEDKKEDDTRYE